MNKSEIIYFLNLPSLQQKNLHTFIKKQLYHIINLNKNYNFEYNFIILCENYTFLEKNSYLVTSILNSIKHKYTYNINLIQTKYDKNNTKWLNNLNINDKIIIIGNDTDDNDNDNNIINYLQCNNYNYFIRNDKTNDNIYETAVDFEIACFCNDIFIGIDETIFSQFINTKIQNKKTILINYINESISENIIRKSLL